MIRNLRLLSALIIAVLGISVCLEGFQRRKKKEEEEITQTLEILPEPPSVITTEIDRMTFDLSPPTTKGLLSQQVRDGIKALWKQNKRATIVKLRAFVAGTGDMRRVQSIVSEAFTDKRQPLPVLSVVQVGALPVEGSQVVLESTAVERSKKPLNPHGLAFISGQAVSSQEALLKIAPLAAESAANIGKALAGLQLTPKDVLRVTCFCSSLQDINEVRRQVGAQFPEAVINYVQLQRAYTLGLVECEAVARLNAPPGAPLKLVNPPGLSASPNYSQVALVGAQRVVLSGTQLAFRYQDDDVRLAFERLGKALEPAGASLSNVAMSSIYPLSGAITAKIRSIRFEFYDKARPPASTMLLFEGLPSLDASFAVDVVAIPVSRP